MSLISACQLNVYFSTKVLIGFNGVVKNEVDVNGVYIQLICCGRRLCRGVIEGQNGSIKLDHKIVNCIMWWYIAFIDRSDTAVLSVATFDTSLSMSYGEENILLNENNICMVFNLCSIEQVSSHYLTVCGHPCLHVCNIILYIDFDDMIYIFKTSVTNCWPSEFKTSQGCLSL